MNSRQPQALDETLERAEKAAWRERQGWCSAQEAEQILSDSNAPCPKPLERAAQPHTGT